MIIAAAVVVLCLVVFTKQGEAPNLGGYTVFRITTGSMRPSYDTDTLILVKKTDPSQIQVGDVISFYSADPAAGWCCKYAQSHSNRGGWNGMEIHNTGRCEQYP